MLNPFPIQWLALLAYFILRCFLGIVLIYLGLSHYQHRQELYKTLTLSWWPYGKLSTSLLITSEILLAGLTMAGAYTQYTMIVLALMSITLAVVRPLIAHPSLPSRLFYVLLLGVAVTLFITGAGALAFDLPL